MKPYKCKAKEIVYRLVNCSSPRISLVKGERYIRGFEEKPECLYHIQGLYLFQQKLYIQNGDSTHYTFTEKMNLYPLKIRLRWKSCASI